MEDRRRDSISVTHPSLPLGAGGSLLRSFLGPVSDSSHYEDDMNRNEEGTNGGASSVRTEVDKWRLALQLKEIQMSDQAEGRKLGVTWKNLTVKVMPSDARLQENVLSQFNIPRQIKESRQKPQLKTILDASFGCVRPGEMLLVLGKPGSGCTTLLKMLANKKKGYDLLLALTPDSLLTCYRYMHVEGDVHYGSLNAEQAQEYRGSIVINNEEEVFHPTLTVGRTMDFATRLNVPNTLPKDANNSEEHRQKSKRFLMDSMGMSHTNDTKIGDAFVRGVSGGERKRVSIIETLAARASVTCWDNATRGLDASTALDYIRALRSITDTMGTATIVTLYQAVNVSPRDACGPYTDSIAG
jgi:ABC-type multidrug transport system ATPase subunit